MDLRIIQAICELEDYQKEKYDNKIKRLIKSNSMLISSSRTLVESFFKHLFYRRDVICLIYKKYGGHVSLLSLLCFSSYR